MKSIVLLFTCLIILIINDKIVSAKGVTYLTDKKFSEVTHIPHGSQDVWFVLFYMHWCSHC